jgi:hypothetical protein
VPVYQSIALDVRDDETHFFLVLKGTIHDGCIDTYCLAFSCVANMASYAICSEFDFGDS